AKAILVIGPGMGALIDAARVAAPGVEFAAAIQTDRLGTAHAALQARAALAGFSGDILVALGDAPFVSAETFGKLIAALDATPKPALAVLGVRVPVPNSFGRLIASPSGELLKIVEAKEANADESRIELVNSGVMAFDGAGFFELLARIGNANAKGEYYLTDAVELARKSGRAARAVEGSRDEWRAADDKVQLAELEAWFQARKRDAAMRAGVTLIDPASVWFSFDTEIGADTVVAPNTIFGPGVKIGRNVEIKGFCHFEAATVEDGAILGPFARLRPGAHIGAGAHVGNFVEIKNAAVQAGAKVNHLTYIGDARIGAKANIGAGTITCNYDGFEKFHTDIGAGAFVGSNSSLVAPVKIGDRAIVGAGSVVTEDVPADALVVGRAKSVVREGWATMFRTRRAAEKAAKKKG
ncbi:MAG: bifunctional UDP-N-acetylglucosamine diphosphorylase/glucosamine-1-phosphate N-acetyltransferase GlmU, partial [Tagaea sp.]|nr:bifunctional UDP-N-acetylglucosamine diphosphorylase/glucosamine-1-phosphate N-acetyltransferase GlmU [Tagaea sp.]